MPDRDDGGSDQGKLVHLNPNNVEERLAQADRIFRVLLMGAFGTALLLGLIYLSYTPDTPIHVF